MRCLLAVLALLLSVNTASAQGLALDGLLNNPNLWDAPAQEFVDQNSVAGFNWISAGKDSAQSSSNGLTLFSLRVYQALARFEAGKPGMLTMFFYNRGDAEALDKEAFFALRDKAAFAISGFTQVKPVFVGKDAKNAVKAEGIMWETPTARFLLESSFTREIKFREIPFRSEFVRLQITPVRKGQGFLQASLTAGRQKEKFSGPAHVKRVDSGDVMIEGVPMVDQGQKGYCVVASAERVMRYYGLTVDEHELAQIANSSATGGTSNEAMFEALKKLTNRLRIKTRTLESLDVHAILELIADYNQVARRAKQGEIEVQGRILDVKAIYGQMKPELLKQARMRNRAAGARFLRQIEPHIAQGVPVLWSVMLGFVPESNAPQGFGGHMRLIVGCNAKTNEIIYTDSWGMGHEAKRMPLADAWTITTGLYTIEPL